MPTIIIDDLTVRLSSEVQNTFNPCYAFGFQGHRGSLALRETQTGHLLLPIDAEGNVVVTPGGRYQLVFVRERDGMQEHVKNSFFKQQQEQQKGEKKNIQSAVDAEGKTATLAVTGDMDKRKKEHRKNKNNKNFYNNNNNNSNCDNSNTENVAVVGISTSDVKKRREREHKDEGPVAAHSEKSTLPHLKKNKKEREEKLSDGDNSKKDDTTGHNNAKNKKKHNNVLQNNGVDKKNSPNLTAADTKEKARRKTSELQPSVNFDKSTAKCAITLSHPPHYFSGSSSDDDDNLPLSFSYAKQQHQEQIRMRNAITGGAGKNISGPAENNTKS